MVAWYDIDGVTTGRSELDDGRSSTPFSLRFRALAETFVEDFRGIAGAGLGFAVAAGVALVFVPAVYEASALLQVDGRETQAIYAEVEAGDGLAERVFSAAAADLGLSGSAQALETLRERTRIETDRVGRALKVVARSNQAESAAAMANAVAEAYRNWRLDLAADVALRVTADLALRVDELRRRVTDAEQRRVWSNSDDPSAEARRRPAETEIASSRALVESFEQRLGELRAAERDRIVVIRLLSDAETPTVPVWPPTLAAIAAAFVLGIVLATAFAHRRRQSRDRFFSPDEIEDVTGAPCLATLPEIERDFFRAADPSLSAVEAPGSPLGVALGGLDAGLALADGATPPRIIWLTAPAGGEGRNGLAAAIARVAAKSGRRGRVALIQSGGEFAARGRAAAEDYIAGQAEIDDLIGQDRATGLGIVRMRGSEDTLRAPAFKVLLGELGERFDLLVIDAPAVASAANASLAAETADLALVVVDWARTPKPLATRCLRLLGETGMRIGSVLVRADLAAVLARKPSGAPQVALRLRYGD